MANERVLWKAEVEGVEEVEIDGDIVSYDDELLEGFTEEDIVKGGDSRGRAWRRKKDRSKARRKVKIAKAVGREGFYKHEGQLVKGKIHCSCPLCSAKTNNGWVTTSDQKKIDSAKYSIAEYESEEGVVSVEDLIRNKDYDYIAYRWHYLDDDDERIVSEGACRSEGGELVPIDDEYTYDKKDVVFCYEEWEDEERGIKKGLTVVIDL